MTSVPDELTEAQVEELASDLAALKGSLVTVSEASQEGVKPVELDQAAVGRLSRMDAMQVQQMAKAARRNQELRLGLVSQALARVDRDDYGLCRRCEEPIGYRRLKARPESPLCLVCQGAREAR